MERPFKLDLNDPASNQIIKRHLARLSTETRNDLLDTLEDELAPTAIPRIPPLTWDAVREMSASKIAIGSHTVHHGWLDGIPSDEAEEELVHSRERIEAEIGKPCRLIAYPNGNWNNSVVELAKKSGYNYALTQDRGINRALDFSPYSIKRIEIPYNETIESFACRVSGLAI